MDPITAAMTIGAHTSGLINIVNPSDAVLAFITSFILPAVLFIVALFVFVIPPIASKIKIVIALGLVVFGLYLMGAFDSILGA